MWNDLRVCFIGDSFVAGVGDPQCLGWVGRLAAGSYAIGQPLTAYNLGVRMQTSTEILGRWQAECAPRFPNGSDARLVVSFGVNDTTLIDGRPRVAAQQSAANLSELLAQSSERGVPILVVAPPPIDDAEQNARTAGLDGHFADICATAAIPYVRVHQPLRDSAVWMGEVRAGDGAHPGAAGYDELAALIRPHWREWLAR
ncbi:GDSL-type esterase/lipase family protein [Nocardia sp. NPDC052112]|uniref:GDSL-type esterase/lipase family protein n=1 Tax=Nocardia sp. NPDC052112 TaxID=3155646 RepID=UPI0034155834